MKALKITFFSILFTFQSIAQSNGFEVVKNLDLYNLIYLNLEKYYVETPEIGAISKAGIDAMLNELDPYTVYYHEANMEDYRMMTTGQYGGIGALIRKVDEYVIISEPYEGNPAQVAGLKAGDKILSIDGRSMKDKPTDEVSQALKGTKGTSIEVEYERPFVGVGKVEVKRDEIKLPDIPYSGMVDDKIGYINLSSFTQTASKSVIDAYALLQSEGMEKLILDLRGNGGGLLIESVDIVNMFVPKNEPIVSTKSRIVEENRVYATRNEPINQDIPVVVLIDENSASASEIVAGSLQDLDRAVIVGRTSFGKGLVQRTIDLKYGSKMKLTIAKYYTPSGRCVQKLDYYAKNEGKVEEVPDSLITIFTTKNGRDVIDGRGIEPDIKVEGEDLGRLTAVLMINNIIFDFSTQYQNKHESIASPEEFKLSEADYNAFKKYVMESEVEYSTASEEMLKKMLEMAKKEGYDAAIQGEYDALMKKVRASKEKDLELFKDQLIDILENEIISRYYYQNGRILHSFKDDNSLKKAIDILNNETKYKKILHL
ncbi:MAG: S41 family peptidase [Crocinitomicaceae bacterium]|nr:S41 family peptidase [Crocinitomicaceae bacterium]